MIAFIPMCAWTGKETERSRSIGRTSGGGATIASGAAPSSTRLT
jgi:hypothetical protein